MISGEPVRAEKLQHAIHLAARRGLGYALAVRAREDGESVPTIRRRRAGPSGGFAEQQLLLGRHGLLRRCHQFRELRELPNDAIARTQRYIELRARTRERVARVSDDLFQGEDVISLLLDRKCARVSGRTIWAC